MTYPLRAACSALAFSLAAAGCFTEAINSPNANADVQIRVFTSGGITGGAFGFVVDGEAGVVRALTCTGYCTTAPGDVIVPLSDYQINVLVTELENGGILAHDGADFGTACCDQLSMEIDYRNDRRHATVHGTISRYPALLRDVATRLAALGSGYVPAVVSFRSAPSEWPTWALSIDGATLDGPILTLDVSYGGGCQQHSIDLVIQNGWLESSPVQAGAILAHDPRRDACDAVVHSRRIFDLTPVRKAYEASYGVGPATIRLNLIGGNSARTFEYRF